MRLYKAKFVQIPSDYIFQSPEGEKVREEYKKIGNHILAEDFQNAIDKVSILNLKYYKLDDLILIDENIKIL